MGAMTSQSGKVTSKARPSVLQATGLGRRCRKVSTERAINTKHVAGIARLKRDQYAPGCQKKTQRTPSGTDLDLGRHPPAYAHRARQHQDDTDAPGRGEPEKILRVREVLCRQAQAR